MQPCRYFIDRDPTYFEIVLNFMREGRLRNTGLQNTDLEDLRHEFQFYKVDLPDFMQPAPVSKQFFFIFLFY